MNYSLPIEEIKLGLRFRKDLGDLKSLVDSIKTIGLLHPIVVSSDGLLIAGQRRLEACRILGISDVPVTTIDLIEASSGEAHENFTRKDLLPSEIVALKRALEPLERQSAKERQGLRTDLDLREESASARGEARDKIAKYLGVGRTTIDRAEAVVNAAEEDPDEYGQLVQQMDRSGKIAGAYRRLLVTRQAKAIEAEPPPMPRGPFRVIVADPPWEYDGGNLPYPTMTLEAIKSLPVREIAAPDAILWLWTTNAHLRVSFEVAEAWGFEYKNLLTWVKDRFGTGDWMRGQTEHCLFAIRGKPIFLGGKQGTVIEAVRRDHSQKPEEFYELVERLCPGGKVELFARTLRIGWAAFGDQIGLFGGAPIVNVDSIMGKSQW
jgi:N6-adenosine-specific RNA methylase IME4/ParB-like chromosome segregation protein Spo0J